MKKRKKIITISGTALLSTIETMESLGPIGLSVLEKNGINRVEENKQYPVKVRNDIFKAVLDEYGEIALLDIGYKNADVIYDIVTKEVEKLANKEKNKLVSKISSKRIKAIEKVLDLFVSTADKFIKSVTFGIDIEYGFKYKKVKDYEYIFTSTMAHEAYSEPFMRGVQSSRLIKVLGRYFKFDLNYEKDKTLFGYGYCIWSWKLMLTSNISRLSSYELLTNKKIEINKSLMRKVLESAFSQNKKLEDISNKIAKYIPPQINEALFKGKYNTEIDTKRKKLTIFFSDIKNFTSISENLQPEDLTKYLNEYFSEMTSIAIKFGGTIDKYIGDAMMVFFGDPNTKGEKEDARACLKMALAMQDKMKILQRKWKAEGFAEPFEVRIGINTGYCNVGNFGSEQRLTYTIIGGEVNVTQRLEGNADPNGILMSYETYAFTQDMVSVEERQQLKMKGINRVVRCYSVKNRILNKIKNKKTLNKIDNEFLVDKSNSIENRIIKVEKKIDAMLIRLNKLDK